MRLAELTGSRAAGTVQIAEPALNEFLQAIAGGVTHPVISLLPGNTVAVRYGVLHARAALPSAMEVGASPRLTLRLASVLVALGLKAVVHQRFIHIHGRQLTIDLASVPALAAWRESWRHLRQVTFETAPGALRVGFIVAIEEEG
jgi:hypothetical protein